MRAAEPIRVSPLTPCRPDGYCRSARPHRCVDRHQRSNHAGSEAPSGHGRRSREYRVDEICALVLERLARVDFRADDIAISNEQLELPERIGNGLAHRHAALEDPDPLDVVEVVEDDATAAANGHDFAHLVGIGPTHVNVPNHVVLEAERRKGDVFAAGLQDAGPDSRRPQRLVVEQEVEDRDVVRREVPCRVHIRANRAEVGPRGVQVVRLTEVLRRHHLFHLAHARVVQKRITDHQHQAGRVGQVAQRVASGGVQRHRLFHQDVTAAGQRCADQRLVRRCRRRDDNRVHIFACKELVERGADRDGAMTLPNDRQAIGALIADGREFGIRQIAQHARVVRSPVAEPDECDANRRR